VSCNPTGESPNDCKLEMRRLLPVGVFVGAGVALIADASFLARKEAVQERPRSAFHVAPSASIVHG